MNTESHAGVEDLLAELFRLRGRMWSVYACSLCISGGMFCKGNYANFSEFLWCEFLPHSLNSSCIIGRF